MSLSAEQFSTLSRLLDQALELEGTHLETWIEDLREPFPGAKSLLSKMLAQERDDAQPFLETLPKLSLAADHASGSDAELVFHTGTRVGNYQLVREIGRGGMGQVWLAEQTEPVRRTVALKLIAAGMYDETVVQRFRAERQSLAIMDHPSIAKVFDAGSTAQGQPYLVMEYVPGLPITEYCDQHKLKIRERLALFIQACEGVQHAHQKAIIHRDLKPANILIVEVDGQPVPRIIDFGLAKPATPQVAEQTLHTRLGQFLGTPGYMSPEQVDSNTLDIDTRSDVYSLAVILYVLLTGMLPFEAKGRQRRPIDEWLRQLREEEPPSLSAKVSADRESAAAHAAARSIDAKQLARLLHGDLDWIAMKGLERDREHRYGTPSELAADLRRYLNNEPVIARPPSAIYQVQKFIRRHRVAAIVATMGAVLALVASSAGLIAVRQTREAQYQAAQARQAQSRLLTEAAAQRLKDSDVAGAQGIVLEVLTNREFQQGKAAPAISVFQEIRAADTQIAVLSGHRDYVWCAAYSPDGNRIVTASNDKTARIWDARTGVQLAVLSGHNDSVRTAAYSPDGTRIVTASNDKTARIWDAHSGAQLAMLSGHGDRVTSAAYSPDGTRIATASTDKTARIWDAHSGAQLAMLSGHGDRVMSAAYSPDGTRIVTAANDKTARIWDARTGAQLAMLSGHYSRVTSAAYSPDGTRIVTTSDDSTARIWDSRSGVQLTTLSGHGDTVMSAAYSPDGTHIVTASTDKTARIWDARTGAPLAIVSGHRHFVTSVAYSPDGDRIVTASFDNTARTWATRPGAQLAVLSNHSDLVASAAYSPDGTRVVTASDDNTARIWDAHTGTQLAVLSGHGFLVASAAYSPDGTRIVTASYDRTARIWDAHSGTRLATLSGHGEPLLSAAYSPDGTRIVTASNDKTARIWDARTGVQLALLSGHGDSVRSAGYSPDGTRIVTASGDKTARIWDARTGAQLGLLSGHSDQVQSAAYSPDGTRIVTASADKTARIWDARTGAQLAVLFGHSADLNSAGYSRDSTRIVTASDDKTTRIWDARTGTQLAVLSGHGKQVEFAAYSPDGARIVTASEDQTARIWDAHVPATIADQILWDAAAETDPLPEFDRAQLGLPADARVKKWESHGSACDQATAAFYDPDRLTPGIVQSAINADIASSECAAEGAKPHAVRLDYQWARALRAKGDLTGAQRQLELAVSKGYRAAGIDLGNLLTDRTAGMINPQRAVSLYQRSWRDGVPIAAFELGNLYENQMPNATKAWPWYQKGADVGEPSALARFGQREESRALAEKSTSGANARLLEAFRFYAAAVERARAEDWPDEAWRQWRYRRATLARLLAREGMMAQVADAFAVVHDQRP